MTRDTNFNGSLGETNLPADVEKALRDWLAGGIQFAKSGQGQAVAGLGGGGGGGISITIKIEY